MVIDCKKKQKKETTVLAFAGRKTQQEVNPWGWKKTVGSAWQRNSWACGKLEVSHKDILIKKMEDILKKINI